MKRIATLTSYLLRTLSRSLAGIVPLALALAFGIIAFEYGMDQAQFVTVAGIGISSICLVTALLLASRANRASSYLLVARLHRRAELLTAIVLASLALTLALALCIAVANLLAGRLSLDFPSAFWIPPTWLPLWFLAAALSLPLSGLAEQRGSHLLAWVLLVGILIANDREALLLRHGMSWLSRLVDTLLWPIGTLTEQASAGIHQSEYLLAWLLTCLYALVLYAVGVTLFRHKDLLWSE